MYGLWICAIVVATKPVLPLSDVLLSFSGDTHWQLCSARMHQKLSQWGSGGWLHVHLAHDTGKAMTNLVMVYRISVPPKQNRALWKAVIHACLACLGNTLTLVCTDLKFTV